MIPRPYSPLSSWCFLFEFWVSTLYEHVCIQFEWTVIIWQCSWITWDFKCEIEHVYLANLWTLSIWSVSFLSVTKAQNDCCKVPLKSHRRGWKRSKGCDCSRCKTKKEIRGDAAVAAVEWWVGGWGGVWCCSSHQLEALNHEPLQKGSNSSKNLKSLLWIWERDGSSNRLLRSFFFFQWISLWLAAMSRVANVAPCSTRKPWAGLN